MARLEVRSILGAQLDEAESRVHEEIEPAAVSAIVCDLVVGVTDRVEVELPRRLRAVGKRLGLARDGEDLAARSANLFRDPLAHVAP